MYVVAALLLLTAAPSVRTKPKTPTKTEQKASDEAARAKAAADAKAAEEAAKRKAQADEDAARAKLLEERKAAEARSLEARGLDARMRALCDLVALPSKRLPGDHREQRFAVMPFQAVGDEAKARELEVVVGDLVVTHLARDHRLPLVERGALGRILDEQALGQSGIIADGAAARVGR